METNGALTFRDLWDAPIAEAISLVDSVGYILTERAEITQREVDRARNSVGRR